MSDEVAPTNELALLGSDDSVTPTVVYGPFTLIDLGTASVGSGTTCSLTTTVAIPPHSKVIVAGVCAGFPNYPTIAGQSFNTAVAQSAGSPCLASFTYYTASGYPAGTVITFLASTTGGVAFCAYYLTGSDNRQQYDSTSAASTSRAATGTGTAPTVTTQNAPSWNNELMVGFVGTNSPPTDTFTQPSGWVTPPPVQGGTNFTIAGATKYPAAVGVGQTYNPTINNSRTWYAAIAGYGPKQAFDASGLVATVAAKAVATVLTMNTLGPIPAGSLVIVTINLIPGNTTLPPTLGSITFIQAVSSGSLYIFYGITNADIATGSACVADITNGGTGVMDLFFITGYDTSTPLDATVTATSSGSGTTPSVTMAAAPAVANSFVFGVVGTNGPIDSMVNDNADKFISHIGFVSGTTGGTATSNAAYLSGSVISSAQLTYNPTLGVSRSWQMAIIAFRPVYVGPTSGTLARTQADQTISAAGDAYWPPVLGTLALPQESQRLAGYPSFDVDYTALLIGAGSVTSRASTATYFDSGGVMRTAAINTPRFDYDPLTRVIKGVLMEDQSTNTVTNSGTFVNFSPANVTMTGASGTAPDATNTMYRMADTAANSVHYIAFVATVAAATMYTWSIFAKAAQNRYLQLYMDDGSANGSSATFDLQTGTLTGPHAGRGTAVIGVTTIQNIGNGIYRLSITCNINAATTMRMGVLTSLTPSPPFAPGYVGNVANGVLIWGPQLEQLTYPTSYIPTTSAAVARAREFLSYPIANVTGYDPTRGSMAFEYILKGAQVGFGAPAQLVGSNINTDYIDLDEVTTVNATPVAPTMAGVSIIAAGTTSSSASAPQVPIPAGMIHLGASSWYQNVANMDGAHDGVASGPRGEGTLTMPVIANLTIAGQMHFQFQWSLWARHISYWPTPQSRADLIRITRGSYVLVTQQNQTLAASASVDIPTFDLDYLAGSLGAGAVFARNSTATYFDDAGVLRYAGLNLSFPSTNWWPQQPATGAQDGWTWNVGTSPWGTNDAMAFIPGSFNAVHQTFTTSFSGTVNTPYTFSCYLRAAGMNFAYLELANTAFTGTSKGAVFNLSNGTIESQSSGANATILAVGGGWYRCSVTATTDADGGNAINAIRVGPTNTIGGGTWTGNSIDGAWLWGRQVETGTVVTEYAPTTTVAAYGPRFDYDPVTHAPMGLLIERSVNNLILQSADVSNAAWGRTGLFPPTILGNQTTAPDGTATAARVAWPAVSGTLTSVVLQTVTVVPAIHTFSIWLKGSVGGERIYLSATTDAVTYYSQPCILTTNWQRFALTTGTLTGAAWSFFIGTDLRDPAQAATPAQVGYVWGAQIEVMPYATSYMPTTTAPTTRAADDLSYPIAAIPGFNPAASSLYGEFIYTRGDSTTAHEVATLNDGPGGSNRLQIRALGSGFSRFFTVSSGVSVNTPVGFPRTDFNRIAAAWGGAGSASGTLDGNPVVTVVAGMPAGLTTLSIGDQTTTSPSQYLDGWVRHVSYWPRTLTNAQLVTVTTLPSITGTLALAQDNQGLAAQGAPLVTGTLARAQDNQVGRTNWIRNPRSEGAVVGTTTLPTYWEVAKQYDLAIDVVGAGTEDGIPYVDLHIYGNTGHVGVADAINTNFQPDGFLSGVDFRSGLIWTGSMYQRWIAGSTTNIQDFRILIQEINQAGAWLNEGATIFQPSAAPLISQRATVTWTISQATTRFISLGLQLRYTSSGVGGAGGLPIDITIRFGASQLERGSVPTPQILPPPGVPARSSDWVAYGTVAVTGMLAVTEGLDGLGATGTVRIGGTLALTQANQTLVAAGGPRVTATLAQPQANQTLTATGVLPVTGTLTQTQASQALSVAQGTVSISATLTRTQADQTLAASAGVAILVGLAQTQDPQTLAGAGGTVARGTLTLPQDPQSLSGVGGVGSGAGLSRTQDPQTITAHGGVIIIATLAVQQAPQTFLGAGGASVGGTLAQAQAPQALAATGGVGVGAGLAVTQVPQTILARGAVTVAGALHVTEDRDDLIADGTSGIVLHARVLVMA